MESNNLSHSRGLYFYRIEVNQGGDMHRFAANMHDIYGVPRIAVVTPTRAEHAQCHPPPLHYQSSGDLCADRTPCSPVTTVSDITGLDFTLGYYVRKMLQSTDFLRKFVNDVSDGGIEYLAQEVLGNT
ncbi:hypothetical protein J6590_067955 [Homalodisca vitripennis]|nr:hypothetical protein J6590_067955 [Homalodisca vitripennis]